MIIVHILKTECCFFATNEGLCHLAETKTWFKDGNFSMAPNIFCQLYIIRVPLVTSAITAVYALLPQKHRKTNTDVLEAVRSKCEERNLVIDVHYIMTYFEDAVF